MPVYLPVYLRGMWGRQARLKNHRPDFSDACVIIGLLQVSDL